MMLILGISDSRKWSRAICTAALSTALVAVYCGASQAGILLDDSWADGSRTETNLPNESAVFFGIDNNASSPQGSVSVAPGLLTHVLDASSTKMWTHFAPSSANPVQLAVGQKLRASVSFIPSGLYENNSRSFRMGLFHDPTDPHVVADVNDDGGGGSEDPWQDSTGYGVNIPMTTFADPGTLPFDLGKRVTLNSSLIGSNAAFFQGASGGLGTAVAWEEDTEYTLTMQISRDSATQNTVTMILADSSGVLSTGSSIDQGTTFESLSFPDAGGSNLPGRTSTFTTFSHLMFRYSINTQVADQLDFTNIRVEVVPEPASAVLILLGALGLVRLTQRKR